MITNQIVEYPNNLWKIAEHISKARTLLSEDVYAEGTDKFRGLQEKEISINGVIGELIVQWYCKEKHPYKKIKFASLVDLDPQPEPDMIFDDGVTIDIKTIPINKKHCNININSHNNPDKKVDWYWCVNLLSKSTCIFTVYKHGDIYFWEQKIGYTEYFSRKVSS
tara:strand:- start:1456 stop:1950 length:495 start_codon:yes stop_codon:yes gene_type:complete